MKNLKLHNKNSAFTLAELMIAMVLSCLIVGLVTSYVVFTGNLTERSRAAYERAEQYARLRQEIDKWFSYVDNADYETVINDGSAEMPLVFLKSEGIEASDGGGNYYGITQTVLDETSIVTFNYPANAENAPITVAISCKYLTEIKFYNFDTGGTDATPDAGGYAFRFTIQTKINRGLYACEFICQGE